MNSGNNNNNNVVKKQCKQKKISVTFIYNNSSKENIVKNLLRAVTK